MRKVLVFIILLLLVCIPVLTIQYSHAETYPFEEAKLTILMYHGILNSRTGTYIVSASQFENDLISIKANNYNFVTAQEVIDYVNGTGTLPIKPILLTFDDGHYNNAYYGVELLKKYNAKILINIIGAFSEYSSTSGDSGNPNYSHLTWNEIEELQKTGYVEFGNHTYNMHKYEPRYGITQKSNESETEYRLALKEDISRLQSKLINATGITPTVFAYPFGKYSEICEEELISMGFNMMLTCYEGVSIIKKGDPTSLYRLKRINRSGSYSTQSLIKLMTKFN